MSNKFLATACLAGLTLTGLIIIGVTLAEAQAKRKPGMYATFDTSLGKIVCELYPKEAPKTVDNFVGLAEGTKEWADPKTGQKVKKPLYNGTIFHRVIPNFMIQGGDPLGIGTGGPGYKFEDEVSSGLKFDKPGRLAMANSGPNTNGSQFFITHVPTPHANGKYTIFGQVIEGQDIVTKIGNVPRGPGDKPNTPVVLNKVTIVDSLAPAIAQQGVTAQRVGGGSSIAQASKPPESRADTSPPTVTVLEPPVSRGVKIVRREKQITVRGKATDDSGIYEVFVNDVEANLTPDGEFQAEVKLAFGENTIRIKATDTKNNVAEETFTIVREAETSSSSVVVNNAPLIQGKYYALIIGIDQYSGVWPKLNNAVHDAQAVAAVLQTDYQFDHVTTFYDRDATRTNIIKQFEWLAATVKSEDNVLIYFSGHGDFNKQLNKGYWVPVDAIESSVANYISNADIQTFLAGIPSNHTLLISDACFAGDIFRGKTDTLPFDDSDRYYREVYRRMSRQAITSGGIEPVTDGGRNGHSVFTYYFLKTLTMNKTKYFVASQLFNELAIPVANNSEQTPIFQAIKNSGDEGGQFIFLRK